MDLDVGDRVRVDFGKSAGKTAGHGWEGTVNYIWEPPCRECVEVKCDNGETIFPHPKYLVKIEGERAGKISISRPQGGVRGEIISVHVKDQQSRTRFLEVEIPLKGTATLAPYEVADLIETLRAAWKERDAAREQAQRLHAKLGLMLHHSPPEHWTGRAAWRDDCQALYEEIASGRNAGDE